MPKEEVSCTGTIEASADRVWSLVGDFHGTWHPAINTMSVEKDEAGRLIRAFTLHREPGATYRERLTWFSNSERSMAYTHVAGIAGVQAYNAHLSVEPKNDTECTLTMAAEITAPAPRVSQIAAGTSAIFDDAIDCVRELALSDQAPALEESLLLSTVHPSTRIIDGTPTLATSFINGPNTDTLCLFLHGIGGNKTNWQNQLMAVAPYCNATALDLRGYGESALGNKQSTVEDYCNDILRVADNFNADKTILCGLSYGAWIATTFATRYPDRLAGLVLSGGCTGMSEASSEEREAFLQSREVPLSEGKTPADFASDVVAFIAGPDCSEHVKSELLSSMRSIPSSTYADALRCFSNPTERFDFSSINMPVLLMTGEADTLAPPVEIRAAAERIYNASVTPDVRFECLNNSGHVCNLEAADAYNTALVSMVRRLAQ